MCFLNLIRFQLTFSVQVGDPEKRRVEQCTRAIDQKTHLKQDGVLNNGTCYHVSSVCNLPAYCPTQECLQDSERLVSFGEKWS